MCTALHMNMCMKPKPKSGKCFYLNTTNNEASEEQKVKLVCVCVRERDVTDTQKQKNKESDENRETDKKGDRQISREKKNGETDIARV